MRFKGLLEVAAVGAPSADSEEEVLVVVVPQPGEEIDRVALIEQSASEIDELSTYCARP